MKRRRSLKLIGLLGGILLTPLRNCRTLIDASCDGCKEAWNNLSRFNRNRYQFRYLEPSADLPKVFLYGDSISIGYTEYVRSSLMGKADVMRLHMNGSSSNEFIDKMEAFRTALFQPSFNEGWSFSWDVIHFNVGLHDLKYISDGKLDKENGEQVSTLEKYSKNLSKIITYLKQTYPNAKLVFASTTVVPEGETGRVAGDAKQYNDAALKVLEDHEDVLVNDLYTLSLSVGKIHGSGPGNVHYKPNGSRLLGIKVAEVIAGALDVKTIECPSAEEIIARTKAYEEEKKK